MTRTVLVIQARMGSSRLPGKVLMDIGGKPMIDRVVERARRVRGVAEVVVATSVDAGDDPLEAHVRSTTGAPVVRGSEDDVLSRFVKAARAFDADRVIRATADCPLFSPMANEGVLAVQQAGDLDYVHTWGERHLPRGTDAEVATRAALELAAEQATLPPDREHVTPWIRRETDRFRLGTWHFGQQLAHHRWTVDEPDDLALIRRVYAALDDPDAADIPEVLALLEAHPEWADLNRHVHQKKWGE